MCTGTALLCPAARAAIHQCSSKLNAQHSLLTHRQLARLINLPPPHSRASECVAQTGCGTSTAATCAVDAPTKLECTAALDGYEITSTDLVTDKVATCDGDATGGAGTCECNAGFTGTPTFAGGAWATGMCTGNACDTAAATNLVANADYSSCVDGDVTGDTCAPTCSTGYATTVAAAIFTLTCAAGDGSFDGADASLSCTGERTGSLRNLAPRGVSSHPSPPAAAQCSV